MNATQETIIARAIRLAATVGRKEITREQAIAELMAHHRLTELGAAHLLEHPNGSRDSQRSPS